ncbi:MAG: biotin--[acetyl-CoA-carboxylase] ligase [Coriobacteriia bacterium]|nr:biotin--[acetyl-CoA-carboxylase] ligase [Coriobacteriia bacterium]
MESSILLEHIVMPCNLILRDEVDSTNDVLKRLDAELRLDSEAGFGEDDNEDDKNAAFVPQIVIAEQQMAGRGRFDRAWASPKGNVYLSLLLELAAPPERLSALSLIVACAVREALLGICEADAALKVGKSEQLEHGAALKLKWPNDLLLVAEGAEEKHDAAGKAQSTPLDAFAGKAQGTPLDAFAGAPLSVSLGKLVGILTETATGAQGVGRIIIGVGVNVARPANGASERAAYLSDILPKAPKRELVAAAVINNIFSAIKRWEEHKFSFAPFRHEYERALVLLGQDVIVRNLDGSIISEGRVCGVNEAGQLLLEQKNGTTACVAAGDVTLR